MYKGIVGTISGFSGHILGTQQQIKDMGVAGADVSYVYGKTDDGKVAGNNYSTGMWGQWCITSSCKNPEAAIKWLNYFLSDEGWPYIKNGGKEGVHYTLDENGDRVLTDPNLSSWLSFVRRKGDFEYFASVKKSDPVEDQEKLKGVFNKGQETLLFSLDNGFNPSITTDTAYINYMKKMDEGITKIVTGASPVSSYDALLDGWYKNGGDKYVKEMQDYIAKSAK